MFRHTDRPRARLTGEAPAVARDPSRGLAPARYVGGVVAAVLATSLLAACGAGSGHSSTSERPAASTVTNPSPFDQVLAQMQRDGKPTKQTALQAFALAFGSLPGVTVPSGPHADIVYGSGPMRWLAPFWDQLTATQQDAVAKAEGDVPAGGGPGKSRGSVRSAKASDDPGTGIYRSIVNDAIKAISARTGVALTIPTVVTLEEKQPSTGDGPVWARAVVWYTSGHTWDPDGACDIELFPVLRQSADMTNITMVLSHEVFHCFQDQVLGAYDKWLSAPQWLLEGEAMYVGEALSPSKNPLSKKHWGEYVDEPNTHLFKRSYSAIGFYAHLQDVGINPWHVLLTMVTETDLAAYHTAIKGDPDEFLSTWAPSWFREGPTSEWSIEGPGPVPSSTPEVADGSVGNGQSIEVKANKWENMLTRVDAGADVVTLDPVEGWGGATDTNNTLNVRLIGAPVDVCTKVGGCTCPEGSTGSPPTRTAVSPLKLGVTGAETGATISLTGRSLDDYCKKTPPTTAKPSGGCAYLDAATIDKITGLHITTVKDKGDSCEYVDPKAPISGPVQSMGQALSTSFSGQSPLRLKGAPNGVPEPQSGAGVLVFRPAQAQGQQVNVHDMTKGSPPPAQAQCGPTGDVSGLNAVAVVCLGGGIGMGIVAQNGTVLTVLYLAPGTTASTAAVEGLVRAAAARM